MCPSPFPAHLRILAGASFALAVVIFGMAVACADAGSLWMAAGTAISTMVYHITVVFLFLRNRLCKVLCMKTQQPWNVAYYTAPGIVLAYVLVVVWVVALGVTAAKIQHSLPALKRSEGFRLRLALAVLMIFESVTLGSIAGVTTLVYNTGGLPSDPESSTTSLSFHAPSNHDHSQSFELDDIVPLLRIRYDKPLPPLPLEAVYIPPFRHSVFRSPFAPDWLTPTLVASTSTRQAYH
ncbi:hypothetical protein BDZ89DRAFT_1069698 [Hymenopellis radicata]|nr:hypothetical protein BDZ89DRAFT_1069698 [Hymenopellis radicata]